MTMMSMSNLAEAIFNLGHYSQALDLYEKISNKVKKYYGKNCIQMLQAEENRAKILGILGQYDQSVEIFERILAYKLKSFGQSSTQYLITLCQYSSVLLLLRKDDQVVENMTLILKLLRQEKGVYYQLETLSKTNMSIALNRLGKYDEATLMIEEAI